MALTATLTLSNEDFESTSVRILKVALQSSSDKPFVISNGDRFGSSGVVSFELILMSQNAEDLSTERQM